MDTLPLPPPPPTDPAPGLIRVTRDARGHLVFRCGEAPPVENVSVARCFPWSCRTGYVSLRDAEGSEVCLLRTFAGLDPATHQLLLDELAVQEFVPRITAVRAVDDRFDVMVWQVETDRGPLELQVSHAEDIRQLPSGQVLLKDHIGGLYEVSDLGALDVQSRRFIEDRLA